MTTSDEMANFCYDHYEHPLLWCEEKKRMVERKNAEESMRMWRRRKAEEIARKDRDKQEYYDLFLKHCPWGRPGGGAPNVDVRRKDITAVGLHSTPSIGGEPRISSLQPCRYGDYFSERKKCHDNLAAYNHNHHHRHHLYHAPPRMAVHSHKVHHISECGMPAGGSSVTICERSIQGPSTDVKNGHVDVEVRYKPMAPGKGKPMLEKIIVTENDKCPGAAEEPAKSPLKKKLVLKPQKAPAKDPWGRAGPGGKPWRSPKAVGSSFMKSLGWTNKEMLKELDQDNPVTPAEKHTFKKTRPAKKMERCCDMCTCQCPAMMTSPLKPLQKKFAQYTLNNKEQSSKFDPAKQKVCPRFVRHCALDSNQPTTDNSAIIGGGVELVPLLARRRANNRPISLSSTDVTKRTASNDRTIAIIIKVKM